MSRRPPRFGEVYTIGQGRDDNILPPVPHLVVSSDMYNDAVDLGVILCEVDQHEWSEPRLHEPIPGVGTALLDHLAWYPQSWLRDHVGTLPPDRHDTVTAVVRNLFGND